MANSSSQLLSTSLNFLRQPKTKTPIPLPSRNGVQANLPAMPFLLARGLEKQNRLDNRKNGGICQGRIFLPQEGKILRGTWGSKRKMRKEVQGGKRTEFTSFPFTGIMIRK